jgi:hypothetical protein
MTHELRSEVNASELDYNPFSMSDGGLLGTRRALIRLLELGSGQQKLQQKYRADRAHAATGGASFWEEAVRLRPRNPLARLFPRPERESAEA